MWAFPEMGGPFPSQREPQLLEGSLFYGGNCFQGVGAEIHDTDKQGI